MDRPAASVVILAWNAWHATENCLETLRGTLGPDDQVIVVDNASADETPARLAEHSWAEVITNAENHGFARGCNIGARQARNEVVVFLNNDTLLCPGWLDGLLAPFGDAEVAATGPRSNFVSGSQLIEDAAAYRPTAYEDFVAFALQWAATHDGGLRRTSRLVGFCIAVRKTAFDAVGGFDERFGQGGCEDDDLCLRLIKAGGTLLIVDDVFVHHEGHVSFNSNGVSWQALEQENYPRLWALHGLAAEDIPPFTSRREPLPEPVLPDPALPDAGRPRVSVVIATLNRQRLLTRALESVAAQTLNLDGAVEVLVVNDGGRSVADVVQSFAGRLPIRLIDHPVNRGRSHAFNSGIAQARAPYIALLADDDLWYPHHLATCVPVVEDAERPTAVYTPGIRVLEDEAGTALEHEIVGWRSADRQQLLIENWICGITPVIPAAALRQVGGFDPEFDVLEDWDLWLRLAHQVEWVLVPVPTAEYRMRVGSGNSTTRELFRFHTSLSAVYDRHPVPAGTMVSVARERFLEGSKGRAEAFGYDVSAVLLCRHSLTDTITSLQSVARTLSGSRWELVLLVPSVDEYESLIDQLDGEMQVLAVGDASVSAAWEFAAKRACGRHTVRLQAGESVDPHLMLAALQGSAGSAADVGHRPDEALPVGGRTAAVR